MKRFFLYIAAGCLMAPLFSCKWGSRKSVMLGGYLGGYNNDTREMKYLPDNLREISGIVYLDDGQKMASINDEEGRIFITDYSGKDTTLSFSFAPKGDFEEIVMDEKYFYVLESRGRIYKVPKPGIADTITVYKSGIRNADFEAMYMDSANSRIVMLCKSCPDYERKMTKPAFYFDLKTREFETEPCFVLDVRKVRKLIKNKSFGSRPSAAAIHPVLNKLFILCSQDGKGLLICDLNGNLEQAVKLSDDIFPQPEGITFAPQGDMYISNEGLYQPGSIIRYPYKK